MIKVESIYISKEAPQGGVLLWGRPTGDGVVLMFNNNGKWQPVTGEVTDSDLSEYLKKAEAESTYATVSALEESVASLTPQTETIEGVEVRRYCGGNIWVLEDAVTLSSEFETWAQKSKVCGRDDFRLILVHQKNDNNEQTGLLINTLFSNKQEAKQIFFWGKSVHSRKIMGIDMAADPDTAYSDGNGSGTSGSGSWQTDFGYHLAVNDNVLTLSDYDGATIASVTLPTTDTSSIESSVSTLESTVSDHETRIVTLESVNSTTTSKVSSLESSNSILKQSVNHLSENISELSSSVSSLDSSVSTNTTNISTNTANISALQDDVDNAKETVAQKAVATYDTTQDIPLLAAGSASTETELSRAQKTNGVYYYAEPDSGEDKTYYGIHCVDSESEQSAYTGTAAQIVNADTGEEVRLAADGLEVKSESSTKASTVTSELIKVSNDDTGTFTELNPGTITVQDSSGDCIISSTQIDTQVINAATVNASLEGLASKATADASGNVITDTYATKVELAGLSSSVTIGGREVTVHMGGLLVDLGTFDSAGTAETFAARADVCGTYMFIVFRMENSNNIKTAHILNLLYNSGKSVRQKYCLGKDEYYRDVTGIADASDDPTATTVTDWVSIAGTYATKTEVTALQTSITELQEQIAALQNS